MTGSFLSDVALDTVIIPRSHQLGDTFEVRRALPSRQRRMLGPFVFLDEMGPQLLLRGEGLDVQPHPHIGLATVTYLYQGELLHRDSIGSIQNIQPGAVNWMTAGRGIVHSERTPPAARSTGSSLHGIQCWVALPQAHEEIEPSFLHVDQPQLPLEQDHGISARIIAGSFYGQHSPVPTLSPLFQVDLQLQPGARIDVPADYPEQAIYVAAGEIDLGRDGRFEAGQLLVLKSGSSVTMAATEAGAARVMLVGGEPMDGPRYLSWNFVSSSAERIEQAKEDWRHQRFAKVPDETGFIPMPDIPGKPVRYP